MLIDVLTNANQFIVTLCFSKDCITWALLPPATEAMRKQAKLAKGRFTGDPSYEYEHVEIKKIYGEGDEVQEEEETVCSSDVFMFC